MTKSVTKGKEGEREICRMLNDAFSTTREQLGLPKVDERDLPFQRNQNQSAVGGSDIANPYGFAIEVKRQEQLSVNSWWKQCMEAAARTGECPVLLYRVNRKGWQCVMLGGVIGPFNEGWRRSSEMRVQISMDDFLALVTVVIAKALQTEVPNPPS